MKITLTVENHIGDREQIVLSNEDYDNLNFVDLITDDENYSIPIDDLYCVVMAFITARERQHELDEHYTRIERLNALDRAQESIKGG